MREVKFRAYIKEDKSFIYSDWKYGVTSFWAEVSHDYTHIYEPLQQYTGLKDKNEKEIYEGDILNGVADKATAVSWNNHYASFVLDSKQWLFSHWFGESCNPENTEVIGNIYEHPELLK